MSSIGNRCIPAISHNVYHHLVQKRIACRGYAVVRVKYGNGYQKNCKREGVLHWYNYLSPENPVEEIQTSKQSRTIKLGTENCFEYAQGGN